MLRYHVALPLRQYINFYYFGNPCCGCVIILVDFCARSKISWSKKHKFEACTTNSNKRVGCGKVENRQNLIDYFLSSEAVES